MPKKKFVNARSATYSLLPTPQSSNNEPNTALRWLRTDQNTEFEPFQLAESEVVRYETGVHDTQSTTDENSIECGEYEYEQHMRVMGTDPTAVYFPSMKSSNTEKLVDSVLHETPRQRFHDDDSNEQLDETLFNSMYLDVSDASEDCMDSFDRLLGAILDPQVSNCSYSSTSKSAELKRFGYPPDVSKSSEHICEFSFRKFLRDYDETLPESKIDHSSPLKQAIEELESFHLNESIDAVECDLAVSTGSQRMQVTEPYRSHIEQQSTDIPSSSRLNSWDCGTIVSTYSVLENHPKLLCTEKFLDHSKHHTNEETECVTPAQHVKVIHPGQVKREVELDHRTTSTCCEAIVQSDILDAAMKGGQWRQDIRRRGETSEERKNRKSAVKQGRRLARLQKKSVKRAFKQEEKLFQGNSGNKNCVLDTVSVIAFE